MDRWKDVQDQTLRQNQNKTKNRLRKPSTFLAHELCSVNKPVRSHR